MVEKISWQWTLLSVQPRIKLLRSFDQRNHSYSGYTLLIQGGITGSDREFLIAIGRAAQEKHKFQAGDVVSGVSQPVADPETEAAEFYKTSGLTLEWIEADDLVVKVKNIQTGTVAELHPAATLKDLLASFKPMPKKPEPDATDHGTTHDQLEAIARKIAALPEKEIVTIKRLDAAASK